MRDLRGLPLLMVIASVLAGLGVVQMTFLIGQATYRILAWTNETRVVRGEIRELQADVDTLREMLERADDPAYLRDLARCQGFVGADEQVIVDEAAKPDAPQGNCESVEPP